MNKIDIAELTNYVENNIEFFHANRIEKLKTLKLKGVLKRKNPYLFKAKNVLTAHEIVEQFLVAHLSSQEETLFGEFLEGLAIFICETVYAGKKSSAEGIDLEFEKGGVKYIVSIKSGPNWGNSSQQKKMKDNFAKAKRILGTNRGTRNVVAVNGCCYGIDNKFEKGEYLKLCGQRFWEFISGSTDLYFDIIEPLGKRAKEKNEDFKIEYAKILNKFSHDFTSEFCTADGAIDWEKLVEFNSGKTDKPEN